MSLISPQIDSDFKESLLAVLILAIWLSVGVTITYLAVHYIGDTVGLVICAIYVVAPVILLFPKFIGP